MDCMRGDEAKGWLAGCHSFFLFLFSCPPLLFLGGRNTSQDGGAGGGEGAIRLAVVEVVMVVVVVVVVVGRACSLRKLNKYC